MVSENDVRFSIRTKLFLLVLVAFSLLILVTVWQIGRQAQKVSATTINQSLDQASVILATKIESRFNTIADVGSNISRDARILPLVYEQESDTLQDQTQEFERVMDFDILFFLNSEGTIMARSDRPEAIGQNVAGKTSFFDAALAGSAGEGYFQSRGRLLQIIAVPVFDNVVPSIVRGAVAVAYEFTETVANEIHALTASEVGFFVFNRNKEKDIVGAVSTYNTNTALSQSLNQKMRDKPQLWQNIYDNKYGESSLEIDIDGERYFAVVKLLANEESKPLGFVMALRSSKEMLKPFADIQRTVLFIGILGVIVASIFAWFFARRISRPIVKLVNLANQIQNDSFDVNTPVITKKDEIGVLYRAVVNMGISLQEKAELENYLAQLSGELQVDSPLLELPNVTVVAADNEREENSADKTLVSEHDRSSITGSENLLFTPETVINNRYQIISALGSGAIGYVYLVQDLDLDEKIAIKLMKQEIFEMNDSINFKEEIRLARRVTHRNILRTFDFGLWQDYFFISMEYVQGYDLDQLIRSQGSLDVHIGIIMARQICSAISAAHEQGIIHLDLKPANIMVNRQGILKIMDFGLARNLAKQGDGLNANDLTHIDRSLSLVGTPRYMAPEQFLNGAVDERTDIYAIGIILFTLFCGAPPFSSGHLIELAELHLHQELPEMMGKNGVLPLTVSKVISKALAKSQSDRYQTAQEMLMDLDALIS